MDNEYTAMRTMMGDRLVNVWTGPSAVVWMDLDRNTNNPVMMALTASEARALAKQLVDTAIQVERYEDAELALLQEAM